MSRARRLGAWVSGLDRADIPPTLIEKLRHHLLDTIGAAIVGDGREPVRIASRVFSAPGETPLLIDAAPRHFVDAARVNAVAAHAAEIDDTEGCDHTGAVVVPVLLALVDEVDCTGNDLLVAMVAGYETGRRMQHALGGYDEHNGAGWHSTATCGVFAATAAASRMIGLSSDQTTVALAIAASSSAGSWAFASDGSMTKQLHVAGAAGNGLQAALLARAGATGPEAIFDDIWGGYFATHGTPRSDPDALIAGLGTEWHAGHSAIKMYAACRSAHPAIDGVVDLLSAGDLGIEDVWQVVIEVSPFLRPMICPENPRSVEAARMSLPISLALLFMGSQLDPDAYAAFASPQVTRITDRIRVVETDLLDTRQSVRVTVRSASDDWVVERRLARGSEGAPFTADEIRAKFWRLVVQCIGERQARRAIAYVDALGADRVRTFPSP